MISKDGRVVSDCCGQLDEEATRLIADQAARIEDLVNRNEGLQDSLAIANKAKKNLQSDAAKNDAQDPLAPECREVLEEWRRLCAPRAVELNGPRLSKCLARRKHGYSKEQLISAVRGYARYPYVVDGRRVPVGPPDKRYVDAELIFRDGKHVDAGIAMDENDAAGGSKRRPDMGLPPSVLGALDWRTVQRANFKMLKTALDKQFGSGLLDDGFMVPQWCYPCPRCNPDYERPTGSQDQIAQMLDAMELTLILREPGGTSLARCVKCGIDEGLLLQALKDPIGLAVV